MRTLLRDQQSVLLGGHRGSTARGSQATAVPSDLEPLYFPLNWCYCAILFQHGVTKGPVPHTNLLPAALRSGWSLGPAGPKGGNPAFLRYYVVQSSRTLTSLTLPPKRWLQRCLLCQKMAAKEHTESCSRWYSAWLIPATATCPLIATKKKGGCEMAPLRRASSSAEVEIILSLQQHDCIL